ncbi:MAG: GAF domain-containing protein, partial [Chloroflexi bacterium]|nr:GAF domain-containing protein [Chloroflexota bacterium]
RHNVQLQTAAEVSRAASSTLELDLLLPRVVELIQKQFNYYYVGLFLFDKLNHRAVLRAATGDMGQKMLDEGYALDIKEPSMIGWCITHKQPRFALDVGADPVRFKNPYLPLTRSELAFPLVSRGEVIGAMTIQSSEPSAFSDDDIISLQTMVEQISNAIQNATLFAERLALNAELQSRNLELERFTYTVSHDLRSPLITIRGFVGLLQEDASANDMERLQKDIRRIVTATDKMQQLLNELLELSRVGRVTNPMQTLPFRQIVEEALERVQGRIENSGAHIEIQDKLPTIYGDPTRLIEVVQNLVDNAVKFMGDQPSPQVQIGTAGEDAEGRTIFFVRDNGIGIDPQFHERVFGLFNKLNANSEGTGVGLALVKRIIEVHNGKIWVESTGTNGSTFYFSLPEK